MIGGGQPTDTGHLSVLDPNGGVVKTYVVEGCLRRKLTAVHLVRLGEGEELAAGEEVELSIDWDRRADHVSPELCIELNWYSWTDGDSYSSTSPFGRPGYL